MGEQQKTIKYDWYQSDAFVFVNVLVKNLKAENVRIDLQDSKLICTFKIDGEEEQVLSLNLAHTIRDYSFRLLPSKVEIKLRKDEFGIWVALEDVPRPSTDPKQYPCSKAQKKDWDKLASEIKKQEEEEHLEGEAALSQMFQKIYADASDETKRAMNKSFIESGGTVLSTNWREVAEKNVDIKAPDGMEWKKWQC